MTKSDILDYLTTRPKPSNIVAKTNGDEHSEGRVQKRESLSYGQEDELITLTRMGKMISDHMLHSTAKSSHVQSFIEVDVTDIVHWRKDHKDSFFEKTGEKLTFTPIFMIAIAQVLKKNPLLNIAFDGVDQVVKYQSINIGMAASLPDGNLIVPVIENTPHLDLIAMATKVNDLAFRSKSGKLLPDEVKGGTYTVTNVGPFGTLFGTPIINQPQSAILAIGSIRKMPRVVALNGVDTIAIRHVMYLSHSYDHRVINGALGGIFIKEIKEFLEAWKATDWAHY